MSSEVSLVGTMTSAGTDVIEMPASTSLSKPGAAVDATVDAGDGVSPEEGSVEAAVVATVFGASVEATDGTVDSGAPDDLGVTSGVVAPEVHEVVRNTRTTSHRRVRRSDMPRSTPVVDRHAAM
ncbi:MAG: hypothetical protein ABI862_00570 [Ilumatobacteraceae bacterium]